MAWFYEIRVSNNVVAETGKGFAAHKAAIQVAEICVSGPSGVKTPEENADFMSCLKARPTKLKTFSAACIAAGRNKARELKAPDSLPGGGVGTVGTGQDSEMPTRQAASECATSRQFGSNSLPPRHLLCHEQHHSQGTAIHAAE
jgi:hypothetical protein